MKKENVPAAVADDDPGAFLQALRNVTEVRGGLATIAGLTGLNRQQLYRTLSENGNPALRSLSKILGVSGLRFAIVAKNNKPTAIKGRQLPQKRGRLSPGTKMARAA